jgi:HPt (histidine-containing phosphotransfer) domain-containing protein
LRTIAEQVLKGVPSPAPAPSPTPHAAELDCFDPHKLLASLEGDMPFLISLVRVYIDDTAKRMSALDDQLVEGDATEALQTAHAIKGGSSSLGAHAMATFAERMEQCLRAGRIDDAISYQQKLNHAFQQVCVNIANFLAADHADTPILDG